MIMRFNEIHKFSDGTLQQIDEALDYRVKEFRINRTNPGMNARFWMKKDVNRSKVFMFAIQKRLKTRRIFRNMESFVGGRIREGDYRSYKDGKVRYSLPRSCQNRRDLPRDNPLVSVEVLRSVLTDPEDQVMVILSVVTGKEIAYGDLKKPFKETAKTLLTQRIIEFACPEFKMPANVKLHDGSTDPEDYLSRFSSAANLGECPMLVWCHMFQQTLDGSARGWFEHLPLGSIDGWAELRTQFTTRFSTRRACFKDPTEITKIVRKTNETLVSFKERWIVEISFIEGVPEVMIILLFMDAHKFPELAKRYSDKVPKTVDEMMVRMDDFVRSEEAFTNIELHKGEVSKASKKLAGSKEKKYMEMEEIWMRTPIVFLAVLTEDISDEPIIIEVVMEGYQVHRIHVDQGVSVEVMFQHCFENLSPAMKSRLKSIQTDLVGFTRDVVKPLGMVELEVVFRDGGLFRRVTMNFTVIRSPSSYNIILGRTGLKTLQAVLSTIHSMEPSDRTGVPRRSIKHSLNANPTVEPICQKRRVLAPDRGQAVIKEVEEWLTADFKNINSACLKDYYPLLDIDGKIESVPQIGRNLEAYVDDMVIKSNDEKMLLAGVAKTFDGLRRINMKLNMKKCSFGVEEGKFLGYMVTFKGIQANQKKMKAIADMQSPQTLKEMKSLSGKLTVSVVLLTEQKGKQCPVHYVSMTLDESERNYAPLEKLALSLLHMSRRLRSMTLDESERNYAPLEKLALSLLHMSRRLRRAKEKDNTKKWTLFIDRASNSKGSGAGLVLISPSRIEFTYALRLNFTSTNNEAEYKALLAGLCLAAKMQVQAIDVKDGDRRVCRGRGG
ncbi:reverse transcriptase domain-containing protein [Tanacetum coccineum]|uniref:Reverse transcriptase domain-containing protein n=1 Tax=Tanacetum coccineum TaxID=301880 RepID=A0ABQ4WWH6_9ASTR